MIEANGLTKSFGRQTVLNNVSFTLGEGRVLGILGPNGAGKTTLIKILALITAPDSGSLTIAGQDARSAASRLRPIIGYVPQDVALFEDLNVRDNLLCWTGQKGRCAREQADRLISQLNMTAFASKKISKLSGGMKRRVNLAVALLDEPKLLILDEPLVGVDIEQRQQITRTLKTLAQSGITQIIASHHVDEMMALADEFIVMKDGEVLFWDGAEKLVELKSSLGTGATFEEVILKMLNRNEREAAL